MNMFVKRVALIVLLVAGLVGTSLGQADKQKHFATSEEAANALTEAVRKDDNNAVQAILGTSRRGTKATSWCRKATTRW
jgi:hypothetical protein